MIHRAYIVGLIDVQGTYPPLDIILSLPGARTAPVANAVAQNPGAIVTAPPAAWSILCGSNWYYEQRSRPLRLEHVTGQTGFVPRLNLGFHLSISQLISLNQPPLTVFIPTAVLPSASLAAFNTDAALVAIPPTALADPAYGPVIRVQAPSGVSPLGGVTYIVNLSIFEPGDDDSFARGGHG